MMLIFIVWLVYTSSYLAKLSYSANITEIIDFFGITKAQAGTVPTFFFFSYGTGQVVNGLLSKRYNVKWVVFISLLISGCINLTAALTVDFSIIKWLWLVNGFVLSTLWPCLIRILSETLPTKLLGRSSVIMGTTIALGTLIIYGLSSFLAAFDKFKIAFCAAAFAVITVSVVWIFIYNRAVAAATGERLLEDTVSESNIHGAERAVSGREKKLLLATLCALCVCAVGINLVKDGLTTWVPSILKEAFSVSDSLSIFLTLFLPILAIFSNAFAVRVHTRIPDYVDHCVALFAVIGGFVVVVIGGFVSKLMLIMFAGLIASSFLAASLNNLLMSVFPLFMRDKVDSGKVAGVLDGFCYIGSAISSYGLGAIADSFGWIYVFYTLLGVCVAILLVWGAYSGVKHSLNKKAN